MKLGSYSVNFSVSTVVKTFENYQCRSSFFTTFFRNTYRGWLCKTDILYFFMRNSMKMFLYNSFPLVGGKGWESLLIIQNLHSPVPTPTFHFLKFSFTHILAIWQNVRVWRVCRVWLNFLLTSGPQFPTL